MSWELLAQETVYEKYGRAVVEAQFRLPSGAIETFSLRADPPNVAVLALDRHGSVIVTRQFRPGPGRNLIELPGGYVNPGETPQAAAERELREETGYVGSVEIVGRCFSDSYSSAVKYCAVSRDSTAVGEQCLDDTEFIEVLLLSVKEFRELLRGGEVADVDLAYLGLDALHLL